MPPAEPLFVLVSAARSPCLSRAPAVQVVELPIGQRHELLAAAAADPTLKDCFQRGRFPSGFPPPPVGPAGQAAAKAALDELVQRIQATVVATALRAGDAAAAEPAPAAAAAGAAGPALSLSVVSEYTEYGLVEQAAKAVISLRVRGAQCVPPTPGCLRQQGRVKPGLKAATAG